MIQSIATKFNITEAEAAQVVEAIKAGNDLCYIDSQVFEMMFEHYCANGEMPYEEATRGDPYAWIAERLTKELEA